MMDRLYMQRHLAAIGVPTKTNPFLNKRSKQLDLSLLVETVLVMVVTIGAIRVFRNGFTLVPAWLVVPGILIGAALLPPVIKREGFRQLGLNVKHLKDSLGVLGWTCCAILPLTFCGLWILKSLGLDILLKPAFPRGYGRISWVFYQFMYIAVAEEVFFRGYVQSNILRLTEPILGRWLRGRQWTSIGISAACFAIAHVTVQGHIVSAFAFLPGLVLGWLFIRTKSLWASILFHGLANAFYLAMSVVFV